MSENGKKYLTINELVKIEGRYQRSHGVMVFEEHFHEFKKALDDALSQAGMITGNQMVIEKKAASYEKAYKKWTSAEDEKLKYDFGQGKTIGELSRIFKRRPGAIRSRLKRMGLIFPLLS